MTLKIDAKFEEKLICCFENDKNLVKFGTSTQKLLFYLVLLWKVFHVWPKKYREVIFHDTEGWCKIWRKTDLWFGKWHEEYGKFSPEHLKVSKSGLWWDPLIQNRKRMSLKSTEELCAMIMKNDAKFEEELSCHFKTDMRNLNEFWSEHLKVSKIFILLCSFWAKYILFELKKYRRVIFHETEERYKIWRRIDLSFQNWHKEFDIFWPEYSKSQKTFTLMGSFWAK